MCIKAGYNELGSVKALMTMSLNAVVAQVFDLDLDDIRAGQRLHADMHMSAAQEAELKSMVAEYFDDLELAIGPATTLGDVFDQVIETEFADVPAEAFNA